MGTRVRRSTVNPEAERRPILRRMRMLGRLGTQGASHAVTMYVVGWTKMFIVLV